VLAPSTACHCATPHPDSANCNTLIRVPAGDAWLPRPEAGLPARPPPAEAGNFIGQRFGSFQVVRELGRGGMGVVWLAEHSLIQKRVAVKVLHEHLARDKRLVARFLSEARTLSLVQHPNVVAIYDLDMREGRPYLVMEHLEGQSLAEWARGPLEPALAVELLSQVCDALGAAHAHGVVHRDLKPGNVFLVPMGEGPRRVKLLDFGLAKSFTAPPGYTPTQHGVLLGTPEYMAPEQCAGEQVDARTDLYAVGIMAYQLLTGTLPFTGHPAELLLAHLQHAPPLAHRARPGVPQALSSVLVRAMAKRPEQRFGSAAELRDALQAAVTPRPAGAPLFSARVRVSGASGSLELRCERVGRAGLFLHTEAPPPRLLEDVGLLLRLPGGELACTGQVVRHVSAPQAREWRMAPGFGVQLRDTAPGFLEALDRLMAGERVAPQTPPLSDEHENTRADTVLQRFRGRIHGDHYLVLGVAWDADFDAVRVGAREARLVLEPLARLALSPGQRAQVERALDRVTEAFHVLSHPERRAEYDAGLRNLGGLLRCLNAGLTVTTLEQCRRRFLSRHRVPEGHATLHMATGAAFVSQGKLPEALAAYEAALRVDPLHLEALKAWRSLRARLRTASPPGAGL
jgi:tRNA A-37 threonylcarbamoyl transferase component Bud32